MPSPKLDWNQIVKGRKPKGSGDLGLLQRLTWKWLRCIEAAVDDAVARGDLEMFGKLVHAGGMLIARHHALCHDTELAARYHELLSIQNGVTPKRYLPDREEC